MKAAEIEWKTDNPKGFRLKLRHISRCRPGGRVWVAGPDSPYKYVEMRFISSGDYGFCYRVCQLVDDQKKKLIEESADEPHLVLDVPVGSDMTAIRKAYRNLARQWHPDKVKEEEREYAIQQFRRIQDAYETLMA